MRGSRRQLPQPESAIVAGGAAIAALAILMGAPPWGLLPLLALMVVVYLACAWKGRAREHARLDAIRRSIVDLVGPDGEARDAGDDRLPALLAGVGFAWKTQLSAIASERDALDAILRATQQPLLVTDEKGVVLLCNDAASAFLASRAPRHESRSIDEVVTWLEVLRLHEAARQGRPVHEQVRLMRSGASGGSSIVDVWAKRFEAPGAGGSRSLVLLTMHDAGEAARALQIRTDFVANASHELRTPIAAMRVAIDTLDAIGDSDDAARTRFMGVISGNIDRLEELIRDLLDLSRLEGTEAPLEVAEIDTMELARSLDAAFEKVKRDRHVEVAWEIAPTLSRVRTDRRLLLLILRNLLENALNFSYERTTVRVVARELEGRRGGVVWEVIDTGIGIPLEQQQRIFERFYQVNPARTGVGSTRRGTGLGLSIVRHAVKALNGTIRVESVWKEGTRMIVELPEPTREHAS
jgi:two-component system phosphate regulon sensor histidine kinase PhoR